MKYLKVAPWFKNFSFLAGAFLVWKAVVYAVAYVASRIIYGLDLYWSLDFSRKFPYLTWIWTNFDGTQYVLIAQSGYTGGQQPYFPFYSWVVRYLFVNASHLHSVIRALIVSNAAIFLSLFVVWRLLALDGYRRLRMTAVALILLFPTSFFYGATYNDSLFFLLATLTLLFARKKQFVLASIVGGLASLTRLNGLALFFAIGAEYAQHVTGRDMVDTQWAIPKRADFQKIFSLKNILAAKIFALILVPVGFVLELVNVQIAYGDWMQFFTQIGNWRSTGFVDPLRVVWRYLKILFVNSPADLTYWVAGIELFFALVYVALLILFWKKIRFSYWIFFAVSILIPALTGTFQGMPRYGLHLYPFFLALALWFDRLPRWAKPAYIAVSVYGLIVFVSLFTRGYFIA